MFPLLNPLALRRALVELRALRRAAERIADALELQVGAAPRSGQTFRGFARERHPEADARGSGVSYVDPQEAAKVLAAEGELRALLGRDPTPEEIERAVLQEVE